jgi:hypothetical protein
LLLVDHDAFAEDAVLILHRLHQRVDIFELKQFFALLQGFDHILSVELEGFLEFFYFFGLVLSRPHF